MKLKLFEHKMMNSPTLLIISGSKSAKTAHVIFIQNTISEQKNKMLQSQKAVLKQLVDYYNKLNRKNRLEIVLNTGTKPTTLTTTQLNSLTLQRSESDLLKSLAKVDYNSAKGLDLPTSRKLVVLIDSQLPADAKESLETISKETSADILLVVFGDDVMSSYEMKELKESFNVMEVSDRDIADSLNNNNNNGDVDGDGDSSEIPLRIVDRLKSMYLFVKSFFINSLFLMTLFLKLREFFSNTPTNFNASFFKKELIVSKKLGAFVADFVMKYCR